MGLPDCLRPPSMGLAVALGLKCALDPPASDGPLAEEVEALAPDGIAVVAADEAMIYFRAASP